MQHYRSLGGQAGSYTNEQSGMDQLHKLLPARSLGSDEEIRKPTRGEITDYVVLLSVQENLLTY